MKELKQAKPNVKPKTKQKSQAQQSQLIPKYLIKLFYLGCVFMLLVIGFASVIIFMNIQNNHESTRKNNKLNYEIVSMKSAINTDVVRHNKLQKILQLIRKKNSKLSSMEMYDIASEIYEMSIKYSNLDIDLLCAVITHESANTWNPQVLSPAGAMGLMQIMPVTGMFLAEYEGLNWTTPEEILYNSVYNIRLGSRFLSSLIQKYELDGALAAYNAGERVASTWLANDKDDKFLWEETRGYIPAIQTLYKQYLSMNL